MAGVTIVFADGSEIALDCTLAQGHDRQAEITEHPVEDGAAIADHIRPKPDELALNAIVSFAPIKLLGIGLEVNRHVAAFNKLERAFVKGELVTVETGLKIYEDMAIAALKVSKDSPTFDVPLALAFRHIKKATAQTVQVPKNALGKASPSTVGQAAKAAQVKKTVAQATPKVSRGPVAKKAATAPQAAKSQSVLFKLVGGKVPL